MTGGLIQCKKCYETALMHFFVKKMAYNYSQKILLAASKVS